MQFHVEDRGDGRGRNTRFQPGWHTHVALPPLLYQFCQLSIRPSPKVARGREGRERGMNKAPFEVRDPRNPICSARWLLAEKETRMRREKRGQTRVYTLARFPHPPERCVLSSPLALSTISPPSLPFAPFHELDSQICSYLEIESHH